MEEKKDKKTTLHLLHLRLHYTFHSCNAASILTNRCKLSTTSSIYIKRHMSMKERTDEKILLQERRSLITFGINRSDIKINGRTTYVNNKQHGTVTDMWTTSNMALSSKHSVPNITQTSSTPTSPKGATVANASKPLDNWLGYSIALWNACSLVNKCGFFQTLTNSKSYDIFASLKHGFMT